MLMKKTLLIISMSIALSAGTCGDDDVTTDGSINDAGVDQTTTPSPVEFKNASDTVEIEATAGDEWIVVPYSVSAEQADAIEFIVNVESSTGTTSSSLKSNKPLPLSIRNPQLYLKWQKQLASEAWTRKIRLEASQLKVGLPNAKHYDFPCESKNCEADEVCFQNTCQKTFSLKVEKFAPTAKNINVTVKRKGTNAAVIVDDSLTLAEADLDTLINTFDQTIYPRDTALFGNPNIESGNLQGLKASDRDNDGLVWIVITNTVAEKDSVGFFVATDFTDDALSNQADILYMAAPEEEGNLTTVLTTMAHEFQHLLSYATKVYKPLIEGGTAGTVEDLWLDEGLSHLAEDACGFGGENATLLDQETFTAFASTSLITGDDSLALRGMAYLFLRYLYEKKGGVDYLTNGTLSDLGGASWLQSLHKSTQLGHENISSTYGDYKAAIDKWMATMALDGRNVEGTSEFKYNDFKTDPVLNTQIGITVRGSRNDAEGNAVELSGPEITNLSTGESSETVANGSGFFYLLKDQEGKVKVTVTSDESDVRFLMVKIK